MHQLHIVKSELGKEIQLDPKDPRYWEEANVRLVMRELSYRYGFPLKTWEKQFEKYCEKKKIVDKLEGFMRFGNDKINPVMNAILCRRSGHPTFQLFFDYVVRKGWV